MKAIRNIFITALVFFYSGVAISQTTRYYTAILRSNIGTHTLWDGQTIRIYSITPSLSATPKLPAPILYAEEGDTVIINAASISQGEHHTIHLHGLDVDTRNDGDPSTSFWLSHSQDTTYTFIAKNAGTYIYHCHVGDVVHVQMGMYGLIVVKAKGGAKTAWTNGPAFHKDYKWLMSEIDKSWHDNIPVHDTLNDIITIPEYRPDYFLINGKSKQQIEGDESIKVSGAQGEFIYMRLANIGFFNNRVIFPASLNAKIIDSDGRPLPNAIINDTVEIMPGERFGVMLNPSAQLTGVVKVQYLDMNTDSVWETENVPVTISGFVGVKELEISSGINIYPNPATDNLTIEFNSVTSGSTNISLMDITGKVIQIVTFEKETKNNTLNLPLHIRNGIYLLKIENSNGSIVQKVVVNK